MRIIRPTGGCPSWPCRKLDATGSTHTSRTTPTSSLKGRPSLAEIEVSSVLRISNPVFLRNMHVPELGRSEGPDFLSDGGQRLSKLVSWPATRGRGDCESVADMMREFLVQCAIGENMAQRGSGAP